MSTNILTVDMDAFAAFAEQFKDANPTPIQEAGLPHDAKQRKVTPVFSGVLQYFPDAIAEVSKTSQRGNEQHSQGKPLAWDRSKSRDQMDAAVRHVLDYAKGIRQDAVGNFTLAQAAWRILAQLQLDIEAMNAIQLESPVTAEVPGVSDVQEVQTACPPSNPIVAESAFPNPTVAEIQAAQLRDPNALVKFPVGTSVRVTHGPYVGDTGTVKGRCPSVDCLVADCLEITPHGVSFSILYESAARLEIFPGQNAEAFPVGCRVSVADVGSMWAGHKGEILASTDSDPIGQRAVCFDVSDRYVKDAPRAWDFVPVEFLRRIY